jgi:hypothetical protein
VVVGLGEGTITVDYNGCCDVDITIDGALVADNLTDAAPPVTKTVSPGNHTVRAFCFSESEHQDSPKNANVPPGGNVTVTFNSCD